MKKTFLLLLTFNVSTFCQLGPIYVTYKAVTKSAKCIGTFIAKGRGTDYLKVELKDEAQNIIATPQEVKILGSDLLTKIPYVNQVYAQESFENLKKAMDLARDRFDNIKKSSSEPALISKIIWTIIDNKITQEEVISDHSKK